MQFLTSVLKDLIVSVVGIILGGLGKIGYDRLIRHRRNRAFSNLLNFDKGEIVIIHSALYDRSREAYNYPSCDMVSARRFANLFETAGKKEGPDFTIEPESRFLTLKGEVDPKDLGRNLILLGGPKRNKVALEVLKRSARQRYDMDLDDAGENRLYDSRTRNHLTSTRDDRNKPESTGDNDNDESIGYDYGLIMSMKNPFRSDRGVLVVAGIHGPGTIGAATYISDRGNLSNLSRRRGKDGIIQEVVCVRYIVKSDIIVEISLV